MKTVGTVMKLVRWQNLLIIGASAFMFYFCLIDKILATISFTNIFIVAGACISIAASGYIINDCYDREIDIINKPDKVYIGNGVSQTRAIFLYAIGNIVGLGLAFWADWYNKYILIFPIIAISILLLWLYSRYWKRSFLFGNITVALLITLPMLLITLEVLGIKQQKAWVNILYLYIFFSFWTTLVREIIKDCEDVEGDKVANAYTMPIAIGLRKTKIVVFALIWILAAILAVIGSVLFAKGSTVRAIASFSLLGIVFMLHDKVRKAVDPKDFHDVSVWCKLLMLAGILSMLFV